MSFDLAVWSHQPRTVKEAQTIYCRLCEGDTTLLQPAPESQEAIAAFLRELTAKYPTSGAFPDDRADQCLWSSDFDVSAAHILMSIPFSRVDEALPLIVLLAEKHGLACHNPQIDAIRLPRRSK